jgi:hypothetical protein
MMNPEQDLILQAAVLARTAPHPWQGFMRALTAYNLQITTHCIQSPLENLPVAQGRAQASARLFDLFANCLASADKIEKSEKKPK